MNSSRPVNWKRIALATMAVLLAALAALIHWAPNLDPGGANFLSGVFWKVALVLALTWVASPQLERLGWNRIRGIVLAGLIVVIVLYAIRPRIGAIAAGVFVVVSLLATVGGWFRKFSKLR